MTKFTVTKVELERLLKDLSLVTEDAPIPPILPDSYIFKGEPVKEERQIKLAAFCPDKDCEQNCSFQSHMPHEMVNGITEPHPIDFETFSKHMSILFGGKS